MTLRDSIRRDFNPDAIERRTLFGDIVQLAFHAPDIKAEADYWANTHGAGPFYLFERIALSACRVHGQEATFIHSSAYGQCGDLMIELIHQHDDAPSPLRDIYDSKTPGLHHAAVFVEDLENAQDLASSQGLNCALDATTKEGGVRFLMYDARPSRAYMYEFYERTPSLEKFYGFIRHKSEDWDGRDVLRRLSG